MGRRGTPDAAAGRMLEFVRVLPGSIYTSSLEVANYL
jgi:hypothetical protein